MLGIPSGDDLSKVIAGAIAGLQVSGVALEDHAASAIHDAIHQAITEAGTTIAGDLVAVQDMGDHFIAKLDAVLDAKIDRIEAIAGRGFGLLPKG